MTDRVYVVRRDGLSFSLIKEARSPAFTKWYQPTFGKGGSQKAFIAIAACDKKNILGYAIVAKEAWNRRAVITDFFVDRSVRRRGVGRKMMQHIFRLAEKSARVLWVETQDVNLPAIVFYRRMGFEVCGFDSTLYDGHNSEEVAVFLSKSLQPERPNLESSLSRRRHKTSVKQARE